MGNSLWESRIKLRPDLVLVKDTSAIVLDVAVTFEINLKVFDVAKDTKIQKYKDIAKPLRNTYKDVRTEAIVAGILGSWDSKNDKTLFRLCSKKHIQLMRKLIVSYTLRYSRDIFVEYTYNKKQVQSTW